VPRNSSASLIVAEDSWSYTTKEGTRQISRVIIGRPRPWPNDKNGDWLCPIQVEHLTDGIRAIAGGGPVDALMNALGMVKAFAEESKPFTPRADALPGNRTAARRREPARHALIRRAEPKKLQR